MSAGHVALLGTTASGKSDLAMRVARTLPDVEIVSVDSMQVYRGMDIGTAKPTAAERAEVPHHLLDLADPHEEFSVVRFRDAFDAAIAAIEARGHRALLVGGTGFYLRAVIDRLDIPGRYPDVRAELEGFDTATLHARLAGLDPVAASRMEPSNRRRVLRALEVTLGSGAPFSSYGPGLESHPPTPFTLLAVRLPADVVRERIARRYQQQLSDGFVTEVRRLAALDPPASRTARQALGYRELLGHLRGDTDLAEAVDLAVRRTRRFARRQRVWFRRDPRIEWFDGPEPAAVAPAILDRLAGG